MKLFLELIQVAIGTRSALSSTPTLEEWEAMFQMSRKQALAGIAFGGIQRLPQEQRPIIDLMYPWSEEAKAIEASNLQHDKRSQQLLRNLDRDGFHAIILKGISYRNYYPKELQNYRTPGDIDVWMWPKEGKRKKEKGKGEWEKGKGEWEKGKGEMESDQEAVIRYCLNLLPNQHVCYIHVDFPVFSDIPVEAHFRPSFLCNPRRNRQLQRWFETQKPLLLTSDPTPFHVVCCELHLFKHLFETGFGMRQLLDYYFLLQSSHDVETPSFMNRRFHQALQSLTNRLFNPEHTDSGSKQECDFLLQEVLTGGNFGKYDPRINHSGGSFNFAWEKLKHNFRLIRHYPTEVLWEPFFRLYHWYWRKRH